MICLFGCFIAAWFLEGSLLGIEYMFSFELEKFADPSLWLAALGQVVVSLSLNNLAHITFANHSDIRYYSLFKMTIIIVIGTLLSHLINGMLIFLLLGFLATAVSTDIKKVVTGGPGLFYESISAGVAILPQPNLTAVVTFLLLSILMISSVIKGC